jgi:hypothetical protein
VLLRFGLALGAALLGWVARSDALKAQSVLVAFFLLANVYWNFYGLMLVPLVLSTLLALKPAVGAPKGWRYAIGGVYVLAVVLGSSYRPSPLGDPPVADTITSLALLLLAALVAAAAFPGHRLEALLLAFGLLVTHNVSQRHLYYVVDYVMAGTVPDGGVSLASAFSTCIPSALYLSCFALQCRREGVPGSDWRRRLASFRLSDS